MFSQDWTGVVDFGEDHRRCEALLMVSYQGHEFIRVRSMISLRPLTGALMLLLISFIMFCLKTSCLGLLMLPHLCKSVVTITE